MADRSEREFVITGRLSEIQREGEMEREQCRESLLAGGQGGKRDAETMPSLVHHDPAVRHTMKTNIELL